MVESHLIIAFYISHNGEETIDVAEHAIGSDQCRAGSQQACSLAAEIENNVSCSAARADAAAAEALHPVG